LSKEDLQRFLIDLKSNEELFKTISSLSTANEIALMANKFGYKFTGGELKSFPKDSNLEGLNIRVQDTSPSYSFGENGN